MRGRMVLCWHPDSPGSRILCYRPWWKRKASLWATTNEVLVYYQWQAAIFKGQYLDAIKIEEMKDELSKAAS
jgi:hypothetical protein